MIFTVLRRISNSSPPYIFRFTSHQNHHSTKTLVPLSHFSSLSRGAAMDVKEASATDLKRPREEDDIGSAAAAMEAAENGDQIKEPACFSSVIPGWFSEMSPMWPGLFTSLTSTLVWAFFSLQLCLRIMHKQRERI